MVHHDHVGIRRVVVVDDHEMFTEALTASLSVEADLRVVGRSTLSDPDLLDRLVRLRPDVVTVDAGARPADVVGRLSSARPDAKVVVLTAIRDVQQVIDAARSGADAWLSKECSSAELVATIRAVCAGHTCYPSIHLGAVLRALAAGPQQVDAAGDQLTSLSRRELCVLAGMVDGLSGPDIAVKLRVSVGTVRSHTQRIFAKLGVRSRLEAAHVARAAQLVHSGCSCS
jgi:DNA-binding NarL/FixJ family response regulator